MDHFNNRQTSGSRANKGTQILEKAKAINTKPIKARLEAFAETHRVFCDAQDVVDRAREALQAQKQNVALLDRLQSRAPGGPGQAVGRRRCAG